MILPPNTRPLRPWARSPRPPPHVVPATNHARNAVQPIMYQHPPPARQIPRMPYYQTPLHEIPDPGDNLRELLGLMDRTQPINLRCPG
jgi:hypothetical protein